MLGVAVRQRHMGEVVGQLARLVLAPVGSLAGRYPRGNTGRSDVSMFAPMELPPDLAHALDAVR